MLEKFFHSVDVCERTMEPNSKRRYTGLSRTTAWREKRKREALGIPSSDSDSSPESDGPKERKELQQTVHEGQPLEKQGGDNIYETNEVEEYELQSNYSIPTPTFEAETGIVSGSQDADNANVTAEVNSSKSAAGFTAPVRDLDICNSPTSSLPHCCQTVSAVSEYERSTKLSPTKCSLSTKESSNKLAIESFELTGLSNDSESIKEEKPSHSNSIKSEFSSDSQSSPSESDYSSDEFSSDMDSYQAYYLEEEPHVQRQPQLQPHIPPHADPHDDDNPHQPELRPHIPPGADPPDNDHPRQPQLQPHIPPVADPHDDDDPDDPGGEGGARVGNDSSDDSDEDANEEAANFVHGHLNEDLNLLNNFSKGDLMLLELACAVRHNRSFLSVIDNFKNFNVLFGPGTFPAHPSTLWETILLNRAGLKRHIYCGRRDWQCGSYIGQRDLIGDIARCRCGFQVPTNKANFFVSLDLRSQLQQFLCIPGLWQKLQYRDTRQKASPTSIEDIYDGTEYRRLREEGGLLASPYNFSYVFNTDGCRPFKKGTLKMWPIYIRINELPPEMRQKFHFVAAVYVDFVDPNFQSFLKPFVRQANSLSNRGLVWKPDGVNEITSRFIPLCHCVDCPARCGILHMTHWNSDHGCTYCTHQGVQAGGNQRYSFLDIQDLPPVEERTHAGMQVAMVNAQENGRNFLGHKGASPLLLLQHHDLRQGQAVDDLHQDHLGCAKDLTELLLTLAPRVVQNMPFIVLLRSIDERMLSIKTPSRISRKPRSIQKRSNYNGSEWRNWLLFFSVPCLLGLISPQDLNLLAALSYACYLLSQDVVEPEDVNEAERLLQGCGAAFEETYGLERIKYNLHIVASHKANCVRRLGPPWTYSTYNFESLNQKLVNFVTSPKGAALQVVTRALLRLTVHSAQYDNRVQEEVRERVGDILNKKKLQRVRHVFGNVYLVGSGEDRVLNAQETQVLARDGFEIHRVEEYSSVLIGNTRYKSVLSQNPQIKSNDTFIYTRQDTYCTIQSIVRFEDDAGEERCGLFVTEHDVARPLPIARHISVLRNAHEDLFHFITLGQVRCPAIKMSFDNTCYAVCVPNCYEID